MPSCIVTATFLCWTARQAPEETGGQGGGAEDAAWRSPTMIAWPGQCALPPARATSHTLSGAEVTLADGAHLTLLAETAAGYGNLCKLITLLHAWTITPRSMAPRKQQRGRAKSNRCWAGSSWQHSAGLIALSGCRRGPVATCLLRDDADAARQALGRLQAIFGRGQLFLELQHHRVT